MAACDPFSVTVGGDVQAALDRVRTEIMNAGGSFSGDASAGMFSGSSPVGAIKGTYQVAGNVVTITITDRPWLAPCGTIESKIRSYIGS